MLRPHPAVLRRLVDEYEALTGAEDARGPAELNPRARDLAYTLCVSTGTRDVKRALEAAHQWLAAAPAPVRETAVPATGQRMPAAEPV
ncbi:DUF5133 domain-containing protein [Streptomyces sp. NEAU-H22]|uniref:DUF5133 domain-containing protein n=1 Tax=unclassified Streptomyces TaxID=2593676 RepID=UPI00224FD11F|nr:MULTISPECIES: DUF5133 domain-containing protein [unclassified Streptomyces]MCX3290712.1 DUF5133 domain-containing protein [Streptomyces sp. NEAU-H22]WMD06634.1 DUF5133 domain-containing protein [Streptomyces sp. FXY-T5]